MVSRLVLGAFVLSLLGACVAPAPVPAPAPQPPAASREDRVPNNASLGLIDQGRQARLDGDYERADGLLQRAQRVQPRNARVYLELSKLYRDRGDASAARHVAERGLLFCEEAVCSQLRDQL
jgi:tetratricopeptide (TPR) repeat protein